MKYFSRRQQNNKNIQLHRMQIVKIQKFQPVTPSDTKWAYPCILYQYVYKKSYLMKVVIIIITKNVFSYQNSNKLKETDCEFAGFFFVLIIMF